MGDELKRLQHRRAINIVKDNVCNIITQLGRIVNCDIRNYITPPATILVFSVKMQRRCEFVKSRKNKYLLLQDGFLYTLSKNVITHFTGDVFVKRREVVVLR